MRRKSWQYLAVYFRNTFRSDITSLLFHRNFAKEEWSTTFHNGYRETRASLRNAEGTGTARKTRKPTTVVKERENNFILRIDGEPRFVASLSRENDFIVSTMASGYIARTRETAAGVSRNWGHQDFSLSKRIHPAVKTDDKRKPAGRVALKKRNTARRL